MECTGCRLCLETIKKNNFVTLEEAHKNLLQILIPVINWSDVIYGQPKVCQKCFDNLQTASQFKISCMDNNKKAKILEELCETLGETLGMRQTCCLCYKQTVIEDSAGGVNVNLKEMVHRGFPQLHLSSSDDLGSCEKCLSSLKDLNSFINSCLETEEYVKQYCSTMGISRKDFNLEEYIKHKNVSTISTDNGIELGDAVLTSTSEEAQTMALDDNSNSENAQEPNGHVDQYVKRKNISTITANNGIESGDAIFSSTSDEMDTTALENDSNSENAQEPNRMNLPKETDAQQDTCDTEELAGSSSNQRNKLENKELQFQGQFRCDKCDYAAKYKSALVSHMVSHRDPSKTKMHKCDICGHETKRIADLRWHMIIHKDPKDVKTYHCADCSYKTKRKGDLKQHVATHRIHMFKCALCSFQTKHEVYLNTVHMLLHKDKSEVKKYKCESCSYETIHRNMLKSHSRIHKDPSELEKFKCNWCDFETTYKQGIIAHQWVHKCKSELKRYKCNSCDYEARYKSHLKEHMVRHVVTVTYDCSKCSYKAKLKRYLKIHMRTHEDSAEMKIYKCDMCAYRGKYKKNLKSHMYSHVRSLQALKNKQEEIKELLSKIHNMTKTYR